MSGRVVSLCDFSGVMVRPWAEAGYECLCFDVQHPFVGGFSGGVSFVRADVRSLSIEDIGEPVIVFAFPPCTNLAVSGARHFQRKGLRGLIDALEIVEACRMLCMNSRAPWMLENPVSTLSTYWRKPDHIFDPCDFGDPWTKKTCLWTGGGFVMPPKNRVEPTREGHIWRMPPSPERSNLRSRTPEGFARAVFEANAPHLKAERVA